MFELNVIFSSILIWEILGDVWHTLGIEMGGERGAGESILSRGKNSEKRQ